MNADEWLPPRLKRLMDDLSEARKPASEGVSKDGFITAGGITWRKGDRFSFRTWLGLKLIDKETARTYFQTTADR